MEWMSMVSSCNEEYEYLQNQLMNGGGLYTFDNVQMPFSCNNKICNIEFRYYSDDKIVLACIPAPGYYLGHNPEIKIWFENGDIEFSSFNELKNFLKSFENDDIVNPQCQDIYDCQDETIVQQPKMIYDTVRIVLLMRD